MQGPQRVDGQAPVGPAGGPGEAPASQVADQPASRLLRSPGRGHRPRQVEPGRRGDRQRGSRLRRDCGHAADTTRVARRPAWRLHVAPTGVERPALEPAADHVPVGVSDVAVPPPAAVTGVPVGPVRRPGRDPVAPLAVDALTRVHVLAGGGTALQPADERRPVAVDATDPDVGRLQCVAAGEPGTDAAADAADDRASVERAEVDDDAHAAVVGAHPAVPRPTFSLLTCSRRRRQHEEGAEQAQREPDADVRPAPCGRSGDGRCAGFGAR